MASHGLWAFEHESAVVAKSAKNVLSSLEVNFNRLLGREFVPTQPDMLHIETCSACNLKCLFCAYRKQSAKIAMKDELFADLIVQAVDMGYRRFELTPCTGDVFMDHHAFNNSDSKTTRKSRATNFSQISRFEGQGCRAANRAQKLSQMTISIYGHDLETFLAITNRPRTFIEGSLPISDLFSVCSIGKSFCSTSGSGRHEMSQSADQRDDETSGAIQSRQDQRSDVECVQQLGWLYFPGRRQRPGDLISPAPTRPIRKAPAHCYSHPYRSWRPASLTVWCERRRSLAAYRRLE